MITLSWYGVIIQSLFIQIYIKHHFVDELLTCISNGIKCATFINSGGFSSAEGRLSQIDDSLVGFLEDKLEFLEDADRE